MNDMQSVELLEISTRLLAKGIRAKFDVPGKSCTTFSIGGPLGLLVEPNDQAQLVEALKIFHLVGVAYRILGAGSNLLIADAGIPEVVVRLGRGFRGIERRANSIRVGGAASLMSIVRDVSEAGLAGMEFAGGIPASLGGAVRMNAGAHGSEISNVLVATQILTPQGEMIELKPSELEMSYRSTRLPLGALVVSADLELIESSKELTNKRRQDCLNERKRRQPLHLPSAGSVFKNPSPKQSAGFLIENVGLKGSSCGGAEIASLHGNWIVNPSRQACATDVKDLMQLCKSRVKEVHGVELVAELVEWF